MSIREYSTHTFFTHSGRLTPFFLLSWQVVRLLGICTQGDEMMMIMEVASRGDLRNFLRDCRPTDGTPGLLPIRHRVQMAVDVANGMKFLASKQFVHRDLACRYHRNVITTAFQIYLARYCPLMDTVSVTETAWLLRIWW